MIFADRPDNCECSFCNPNRIHYRYCSESYLEIDMEKKDIDKDRDSDQRAPFCPYEPGLDPKIGYKQEFHYAPADLYPRHYKK